MNEPVALIVEDDAKLADIFSSAVRAAGFVTVVAENGRTALTLLQSQTPALIVLDLHLPDVPGAEVLTFIKQAAAPAADGGDAGNGRRLAGRKPARRGGFCPHEADQLCPAAGSDWAFTAVILQSELIFPKSAFISVVAQL
jgi:PleD family two-component response regulator